jgi:hypothetical protein
MNITLPMPENWRERAALRRALRHRFQARIEELQRRLSRRPACRMPRGRAH